MHRSNVIKKSPFEGTEIPKQPVGPPAREPFQNLHFSAPNNPGHVSGAQLTSAYSPPVSSASRRAVNPYLHNNSSSTVSGVVDLSHGTSTAPPTYAPNAGGAVNEYAAPNSTPSASLGYHHTRAPPSAPQELSFVSLSGPPHVPTIGPPTAYIPGSYTPTNDNVSSSSGDVRNLNFYAPTHDSSSAVAPLNYSNSFGTNHYNHPLGGANFGPTGSTGSGMGVPLPAASHLGGSAGTHSNTRAPLSQPFQRISTSSLAASDSRPASSSTAGHMPFIMNNQLMGEVVTTMAENVAGISREDMSTMHAWFPQTVSLLRTYFAVSHRSVRTKLFRIFLPPVASFMRHKSSADSHSPPPPGDITNMDAAGSPTAKGDHPTANDLYIPLMAFITYVLLVGLTRGTLDDFHPELLTSTSSFAGVCIILEVLVVKGGFYLLGGGEGAAPSTFPLLDIIAVSGSKFVGLAIVTLVCLFTTDTQSLVNWVVFIYFSLCSAMHVLSCLRLTSASSAQQTESDLGVKHRLMSTAQMYLAWSVAAVQIPLFWILLPSWRQPSR